MRWPWILGAAFVAGACYKGEAPEPPPLPTATARATASASATSAALPRAVPAPSSSGPQRASRLLEDPPTPEAKKALLEALRSPPVLFDPGQAPKVTLRGLENTALGETKGLVPDGPPLVARLKAGQRATRATITLEPHGCTTFIAHGGLGVAEVDLFLAQGSGDAIELLAEDGRGGPIAVIGGESGCIVNPTDAPIVCDLHVSLRRGEGIVLVRGFYRSGATVTAPAASATAR